MPPLEFDKKSTLNISVELVSNTLRSGDIDDPHIRSLAIQKIVESHVVALEALGTGGLIYDPFSETAASEAIQIKAGMRRNHNTTAPENLKPKTTSLLITLEQLAPIVDVNKLSPQIKNLLWEPTALGGINFNEFAKKVGGLFFLKLPIFEDARVGGRELPPWAYSVEIDTTTGENVKYIHALCLDADPAIGSLMQELREKNVPCLGVTSMNYSNKPEIVNAEAQKQYAAENNLFYLEHPTVQNNEGFMGSFTIVGWDGRIIRGGTMSPNTLQAILGDGVISWDDTTPQPKYTPLEMDPAIIKELFVPLNHTEKVAFMKRYAILKGEGKTTSDIRQILTKEFKTSKGEL